MKRAAAHILEILPSILDTVAEVSGNFGVPGLQAGVLALLTVMKKAKTVSANIDGMEELEERISKLADVLIEFRGKTVPEVMQQRINVLFSEWEKLGGQVKKMKSPNFFVRFLKSSVVAEELSGLVQKFNMSLREFQFESALYMEAAVHEIRTDLQYVREQADDARAQRDESFMPTYAKNAHYSANNMRGPCLEGTRVGILDMVRTWIDMNTLECAGELSGNGKIFWANGMAGTGKTSIAFSVAEECFRKGRLGGCFFCSCFDAECSDPNLIFVTISRQLCRVHPAYKEKVIDILKHDPDIVTAGVSRQLEELIVRPLEALKGTFPTSVIVIDALDECKDKNATSIILNALSRFIGRLAPLLLVITSRPEPRITALFEMSRGPSLADVTTSLLLHEVQIPSVTEDIKRFLDHGFDEIRRIFKMESSWPSTEDIDRLANLAGGLFIFAKTALAFIEDERFRDPEEQLRSLLLRQSFPQTVESPMDKLYLQILEESCKDISDSLAGRLQIILGAITLIQEPLSTADLATFLKLAEKSIRVTLSGLHSVLHIPDDSSQLIRVIHPTFPELLSRHPPPKGTVLHIQSAKGHATILFRCFDIFESLRRNMLNVQNPTLFKEEISNLSARVAEHIPSHLSYACKHWAAHLQGSLRDPDLDMLFDKVQSFINSRLLYWLEACSWLDALAAAVNDLDTARHCFASSARSLDLVPLLIDCRRFLLAYFACIDAAPLQVYHSALSLAPRHSLMVQVYANEAQHPPTIRQGGLLEWGPCLATISGDKGQQVYSVAFSPNGHPRFATGDQKGTISIWHSANCTRILSIDGHRGSVRALAYSPDGNYILSSSEDRTVRIWGTESGAHVQTLQGHTGGIYSATYFAGGTRVISATSEGQVKLWDPSDGRCLDTFIAGSGPTWQVSISPDGTLIAHSNNSSLCLLNISTGKRTDLQLPRRGERALFSPNGLHVADATGEAIHIWTVIDGALQRTIDIPERFNRMAFSNDSTRIACACYDGFVRVWQVVTDNPPRVLASHVGRVYDIAWSPDSLQIISSGQDGAVRGWDISHRTAPTALIQSPSPPLPHGGTPNFAVIADPQAITLYALSPAATQGKSCGDFIPLPNGGPRLTLCSTSIEAWELATQLDFLKRDHNSVSLVEKCWAGHAWRFLMGRQVPFQYSTGALSTMPPVLSQDASLMAYVSDASRDSIQVHNLTTGTILSTSTHGHAGRIGVATFSPHGNRLATGSHDGDVKIWDVTSGKLIAGYSEHKDLRVTSCTFSSDSHHLASGQGSHGSGIVCVRDLEKGRALQTLRWFQSSPDVIFTPDDKAIATLSNDPKFYYFSIWDIATGACIHRHQFDGNASWLHLINFSPDDTGITLGPGDDVIHLWRPGTRTWPVYFVDNDGWVYAKRPGRTQRLCWLPLEWRFLLSTDGDTFCVLDRSEWRVVELYMSRLLQDAEAWS